MPRKTDQIVEPLNGSLDTVADALLRSTKKLRVKSAKAELHATHKGTFKEEFGIDVDCYVLDDDNKTAVISKSGMASALGLSVRSNALARFASSKSIAPYLSAGVIKKLGNPLIFQWHYVSAPTPPPAEVHGYDVTLLIDICKATISAEADGKLQSNQLHVAKNAHVIVGASAKAGIKGLVYALSGYDTTRQEVITAFKMYVQQEAREYSKEFPEELYESWYRLYEIPVPARGKPWDFKHLTIKHIYAPLAKSNGKILELTRILKAQDGDKKKKLFQFLNELGARALRIQLGRVLEMAESSESVVEYEKKIVKRFGGQQELDI